MDEFEIETLAEAIAEKVAQRVDPLTLPAEMWEILRDATGCQASHVLVAGARGDVMVKYLIERDALRCEVWANGQWRVGTFTFTPGRE